MRRHVFVLLALVIVLLGTAAAFAGATGAPANGRPDAGWYDGRMHCPPKVCDHN